MGSLVLLQGMSEEGLRAARKEYLLHRAFQD